MVAYPPGGVSDAIARAIAEKLALQLGVPVLVDNRAGAGGSVAIDALAKSPADGYTLCFSAITPLTLLPHLGPVNYDPVRDIAPVASVMSTPVLLVATPALDVRTFAAMLAAAREKPGRVRWATSGQGTTGHMVLEQVRKATGTDITHIPYKGGGQQLNDALGGQFEVLSTNVGAVQLGYIDSGRFKPLAVGAPARLAVLPDVPTLAELGVPQANLVSLFGLFAPSGTPAAVVRRLNTEVNRVLALPEMRERMQSVNNLPSGGSAAGFARVIAEDSERSRRALLEDEGTQRPGGR
ncbi:MAG: transporter substrate-binding protein [Rhodoferax sp.]|nr:transporter substrate-binding protein [Rhodoferax sp.]